MDSKRRTAPFWMLKPSFEFPYQQRMLALRVLQRASGLAPECLKILLYSQMASIVHFLSGQCALQLTKCMLKQQSPLLFTFQTVSGHKEQDSKECSFVLFLFLFLSLSLSLFLRRLTAWQSLCLAPCITQLHIETAMS